MQPHDDKLFSAELDDQHLRAMLYVLNDDLVDDAAVEAALASGDDEQFASAISDSVAVYHALMAMKDQRSAVAAPVSFSSSSAASLPIARWHWLSLAAGLLIATTIGIWAVQRPNSDPLNTTGTLARDNGQTAPDRTFRDLQSLTLVADAWSRLKADRRDEQFDAPNSVDSDCLLCFSDAVDETVDVPTWLVSAASADGLAIEESDVN